MKLRVLDQATVDIAEGDAFYERQLAGVGSYFLETLVSDIESLRLYGGIHRQVFGYYQLLSKRFPFAGYYKIEDELVYIWRVLDCRRNPSRNRVQLKSRRTR